MPKSTLALKATVTRRKVEPVPPDMAERLEQLHHHQAVTSASNADPGKAHQTEQEATTAPAEPKLGKQLKREANALQAEFLASHLNRQVVCYLINGVKLIGKLREFDQFTLLLEGPTPMLVFKHSISTIAPDGR